MEETKGEKKRDYLLPASILIAALLVSVSLFYNAGRKADPGTASLIGDEGIDDSSPRNVKPISEDDHIRGRRGAPLTVIEFSDLECPFCKSFHSTMKEVLASYGDKVAWVYRHFPLDTLHTKARNEALASECAAEAGGNDAFWAYVDRVFEITPSNDGLNPDLLPQIAEEIGLDRNRFEECLVSGKHEESVEADVMDAVASGGRGTPYSVVLTESGSTYIIPGALPFERIKPLLDQILGAN